MLDGKRVKVLTLLFNTEIAAWEVGLFRGAVLNCIGQDVDVLFHNHTDGDGFRYSYPLIQYKRLNGKAAIVCVQEGVDSIGQFLMAQTSTLTLADREVKLEMQSIKPQEILMQTWQSSFSYRLEHWLPLNAENYQRYRASESLTERTMLLESILRGNLLSMCKGLDIHLSEQLEVSLTRLSEPRLVRVKGIKAMSFDAEFRTNLSMPDGVGVGKNASLGYGTIHIRPKKEKQQINNNNDEVNDKQHV